MERKLDSYFSLVGVCSEFRFIIVVSWCICCLRAHVMYCVCGVCVLLVVQCAKQTYVLEVRRSDAEFLYSLIAWLP